MIDFWMLVKYIGAVLMAVAMCWFVGAFMFRLGSGVDLWKSVALFWFGSSSYWQGCWYGGD